MLEGPKGFSGLLLQLEAESQHNPNDIELMQRLGRLYFRNNSIEEATRVFRQILQLDENNLSALVELSLCLSKVGNFDEAEFNLERAQEIRPGFHTLYLAFSKLHEAKGNAELQVSYMMRAANAAPEKLDIRLALADLLKKYGDLSGAIFQYKLILEKNPNFEAALFALGTILMKRNEVSPAIGYFQRVIEFNPGAFDAHFNLGSCFFRQKKYSYALRNLQFAVRAQGLQKKSLYLISQSYTKLGDFDRAIVI
jgi:tetratricopeptide (TPR) repeat protein